MNAKPAPVCRTAQTRGATQVRALAAKRKRPGCWPGLSVQKWTLVLRADGLHARRESRNFPGGGLLRNDALGSRAHQLRLRRLEGGGSGGLVARGDRLVDLAHVRAYPAHAVAVGHGAARDLARCLLGGRSIGHTLAVLFEKGDGSAGFPAPRIWPRL